MDKKQQNGETPISRSVLRLAVPSVVWLYFRCTTLAARLFHVSFLLLSRTGVPSEFQHLSASQLPQLGLRLSRSPLEVVPLANFRYHNASVLF